MNRVQLLSFGLCCGLVLYGCGGTSTTTAAGICDCSPSQPATKDYRHAEKHVPLPTAAPETITVATMLGWPQPANPAGDAPRAGRELQLFTIPQAFVQLVYINRGDCDIHLEIADSSSKSAPRAIVETPVDPEYCPARQQIQSALAAHGVPTVPDSLASGELPQAIPAQVTGLAFQDFRHGRGSSHVATVWELHPAVVTFGQ